MKKIVLFTGLLFCSLFSAQNVQFSDTKFKALMLSSSPSNTIAMDFNNQYIAIDVNNDGEIQLEEAANVKLLNVEIDKTKYLTITTTCSEEYPDECIVETEINDFEYYDNHLPEKLDDVLLFTNLEELHVYDTKSFKLAFVDNSKIKKVSAQDNRFYYTRVGSEGDYIFNIYSFDLTLDNCPQVSSFKGIVSTGSGYEGSILRIKNNPQFRGVLDFNSRIFNELHLENLNYDEINLQNVERLSKFSVANNKTLKKLNINPDDFGLGERGSIDLIANNCIVLEEIIVGGSYYDNKKAYITAINVDGDHNLKIIKGLQTPIVDFSNAGLVKLEELDFAFYNRNGHYTGYGVVGIEFGVVESVNLQGLPSLKKLIGYNNTITSFDFAKAPNLEYIDITNSVNFSSNLGVRDLPKLKEIKTGMFYTVNYHYGDHNPVYLKEVSFINCPNLENFNLGGNSALETLNIKNCNALTEIKLKNSIPFSSAGYEYVQNEMLRSLKTINIQNCEGLEKIFLLDLSLSEVNLDGNINLKDVYFEQTRSNEPSVLKQIDLSTANKLEKIELRGFPYLEFVNIHNNSIEDEVIFAVASDHLKVCVDPEQLDSLVAAYPAIEFTTDCSKSLGVDNFNSKDITIFPNPTKGLVSVSSPTSVSVVNVIDMQGRIVKTIKPTKDNQINVSSLAKGIYYLQIKIDDKTIIKKVIKD